MFTTIKQQKSKFLFSTISRTLVFVLSFSLIFSPVAAHAQSVLNLPIPGAMITPSPAFAPVLLKGMTIHPDNPLKFDFIIDSGDTDFTQEEIKKESERLVKYFLASMTVPKDDLWVNLSPYENDRIIPDELGKTELGRDMLAQDYILKQLTASLMYPEKELGKKFWDKVYAKAEEQFGTREIPVNTFNKVWILPESATVYEHEQTVYVVDAYLKVMLDSDYQAMQHEKSVIQDSNLELQSSIIKEIIIPEIEREVNEGQHFAPLRQIYHSLILAKWYKETVKNSLLSQVYVDKNLIAGVESNDPDIKDKVYAQYMEAYKKGVFNFIKEDYDALSQEMIPRKYFSGGFKGEVNLRTTSSPVIDSENPKYRLRVEVLPRSSSPVTNPAESLFFPDNVETNANIHAVKLDKKAGIDVSVNYLIGSEDMNILNSILDQKEKTNLNSVRVFQVSTDKLKGLQYAYDRSKRVLYLAKGFEDKTDFELVTGMQIFLAAAKRANKNGVTVNTVGYDEWEKQDLVAMAKGWAAVNRWAEQKFSNDVRALFPGGKTVAELKESFEKALWAGKKKPELKTLAKKTFGLDNVNFDNLVEARAAQKEVKDRVSAMWELIGNNALYAGVNYSKRHPVYDKIDDINGYFSAGQLSAKFNPVTLAHLGVTILSTFALSGVNNFRVNVSVYDPRKPDIEKTYPERLELARADIEKLFGGLVSIYLERDYTDKLFDLKEWNGEEIFAKTVKKMDEKAKTEGLTADGSKGKQVYTAGGDHFFVFAPDKIVPNMIGFMDVTNLEIRKYQTFYVNELSDGSVWLLRDLIIAQVDGAFESGSKLKSVKIEGPLREFYVDTDEMEKRVKKENKPKIMEAWKKSKDKIEYNPKKRKDVINDLMRAKNVNEIRNVYETAEILPSLDVALKLMLIQEAYRVVETIFAHTNRKEDMKGGKAHDSLRDALINAGKINVMNIKGFDKAFSATKLRAGLIRTVYSKFNGQDKGTFYSGSLYGASQYLLESLLKKSPITIETLLMQDGLELPYVFQGMWDKEDFLAKQKTVLNGRNIRVVGADIFEIDNNDKYTSAQPVVSLYDSTGNEVASVMYSVVGNFSKDGDKQYTVKIYAVSGSENKIDELITYVNELNKELLSDSGITFNKAQLIRKSLIDALTQKDFDRDSLLDKKIDVLMIPGNDDLNVFGEVLDLKKEGIGEYILISGGNGRLTEDLKRVADENEFDVEIASEAEMIRDIMVQMAQGNPEWVGLVDGLQNDEFTILEPEARFTVENFSKAKEELTKRGFLGEGKLLKMLYIQKPLQQLRTKGNFNSVFADEMVAGDIEGVSYTTEYIQEPSTQSDIVAEFFRIIINAQKLDPHSKGDWVMEGGLASISETNWVYASAFFEILNSEEQEKLVIMMLTNMKNMGVDRTQLLNNLPKHINAFAENVLNKSSSPISSDEKVGGIDMNEISVNRQGSVNIQFDPVEIQEIIDMGITGFAPVIINLTPLPSILPLLGLAPQKEDYLEVSSLN